MAHPPGVGAGRELMPEPVVDTAISASLVTGRSARRTSPYPTASPRTRGSRRCWSAGQIRPSTATIDWGFGEIIALGSLLNQAVAPFGSPGRTPAGVPSSPATPAWSTPSPAPTTSRCSA